MPETPRDDAWLGYLAQVEPGFDGLRTLVVQLGGLLLLELSRSRLLVQSEPLLPVLEALGENGETLRGINDGLRESQDSWILCGDLIYSYENLLGPDPTDPQIVPIGLPTGSQTRLIETSARMLALVQQNWRRVVPVHEERLPEFFPTRITEAGLRLIELTLADGDASRTR